MTSTVMRRTTATTVFAIILYGLLLRRPVLTRGATADEAHARLPGDTLLEDANGVATLVNPEHALATQSADGNWVWTFVLREHDGATRPISRNRFRLPKLRDKIGMLSLEPASLVIERKMLLGIKQRAERLARTTEVETVNHV
jgi:hypothetical protein